MGRNNRPLQLDRENAKWLGVCAGIANFLEVKPWSVRMVFLGCLIFGAWFLFPLYFIAWYLMNDDIGEFKANVMANPMVKHFRNVDYRKKIYRNTRDGKICGVCAGIADYLEVSVFPVRLFFMLVAFLAGFPVLLYVGAAMVLDKKPAEAYQYESRSRSSGSQFHGDDETAAPRTANTGAAAKESAKTRGSERSGFRDQYSQRSEFQYCARRLASLKQRLARMEAYITSNRFKLQREFKGMS
jgi:phage shock protein C